MKSKMIVSSLVSIMMLSQVANVNVFANENVLDEADVVSVAQVQAESVVSNQSENIINSINIGGVGVGANGQYLGTTGFTINFDKDSKKIKIDKFRFGANNIQDYFGDSKYLEVKLYGADGTEKKSVTLKGNDRVHTINKINNADFEYGDYIKIYHAEGEGSHRYNVTGEVIDKEDGLKEYTYKITENGLQQVFVINKINIGGIGVGDNGEYISTTGFTINFDKDKIKISDLKFERNKIHDYFENKKYVEVKLYGADGAVKETVTLNGNDRVYTIKKIDGVSFEYGDIIEIYHAEGEGSHRYDVTGEVIDKNSSVGKNYRYKITKNGLQQITGTN